MHPILANFLETLRVLRGASPVTPGTSTSLVSTELNHQQTDDVLVDSQEGDTEISTYPEVHMESPQLNGEPHLNTNEQRWVLMHTENDTSPKHLFFPDQDPNNEDGAGTGRGGPSVSDGQTSDEKLNKFSKKTLTLDDLRLYYPSVAARLAKYGVLSVDRETFEVFYKECTRQAMLAQKPVSEVFRDA